MINKKLKKYVIGLSIVFATPGILLAAPNEFDLSTNATDTMARLFDGKLLPDQMVEVLSQVDTLVPSATISKGTQSHDFIISNKKLGEIEIKHEGEKYDLFDFLALNRIAGIMILKDGKVVLEEYQLGLKPDMRWLSASMIKSVTSTLVGIAIKDGHIKSLQDAVTDYLPQLKGSGYEDVTLENILQMRSGVSWDETYNDPSSDRRKMLILQHEQKPGAFIEFMSTLTRDEPAGSRYNYSTGETYLIGSLIEAAVGKPLPEYLSERLWQPLGMQQDGRWWLMSSSGPITAGGGYAATLRDYARFAQFVADDAVIDGKKQVPDNWFEQAAISGTEDMGYGYQWWTYDKPNDATINAGALAARGVYGQSMYIHPKENIVVVLLGAQSKTAGRGVIPYDLLHSQVVELLRE